MLGSIFSSSRSSLSAEQMLELTNTYLNNARKTQDSHLASIFCDEAEISLSQAKQAFKRALSPETLADQTLRNNIGTAYFERGKVLDQLGQQGRAQASYQKAQKWGYEEIECSSIVSGTPALTQTTSRPSQQPVVPAHEKSELVEYLFEKALLTLSSLEVSNKPSLFLVYAHDNPNLAPLKAEAKTSKYLIEKLFEIRGINLFSDQMPTGQRYSSSSEDQKKDGKLEDILTNQLCLLPYQLIEGVKPVNKVVVCCSEVLGKYLKDWPYYNTFYEALREAYLKDGEQKGTSAIREVVRKFSQEPEYKAGFHHVLTEIAFLQIRKEHLKDEHGIIPVSLTENSYEPCLAHFIPATTVRMEDIPRLEEQVKAGEAYPNQSRHGVLFKVIERLLVGSEEAQTFLDKFWKGYGDCILRLKKDSTLGEVGFARLLDGIFDNIRATLHKQLASTMHQQHHQLRLLNEDPRAALKEQYFAALKQDEAFQETLKLYVEPRCRASLDGESKTFELLPQVQEFLKDKKVILLTGDSGAGKTTFNRLLEKTLWGNEHDEKEPDAIPLFISLSSIDKPEQNLIAKALKKRGLSDFQIDKLKKVGKQRFVFILDGYDEIRQTQNLYVSNRINQSGDWQGRMVISCRSEYWGQDYRSRFQPNPILQDKDTLFQEVVVEPFSEEESDHYLKKYVEHNPTGWTAQTYREAFSKQSNLKNLISRPFLLRVVLEALPYLDNEGKARSAVQLHMDLYDQFVRRWFRRNEQRLSTQDLTATKKEIFRELSDDDFAEHGIAFAQDLAVQLYTENAGNPVVEYSLRKDKGNWKDAFFGLEEEKQLLREAWPLIRSGTQYRFIHKSLLEYFVAQALFESFDECIAPDTRNRRGSDVSVYSFENQPVLPHQTLRKVSLAPKDWVGDLGVVQLLTERVQQEPVFKERLFAIIECSKTDAEVRQTAANAITILVRAGVQFNGTDLKEIQIPGADLSYGVFDSAQLQGADLRRVNFGTSWLREANLSSAQMAGVNFGELPFLKEDSDVNSCAYSPDGSTFAAGFENGNINVYATSNWERIEILSGHTDSIYSVVYSPKGDQIASGGKDSTVRLWDVKTGTIHHTLSDHSDLVWSIVYSPKGDQIASGGKDNTIRLWDVKTGIACCTLRGHTDWITSVAYSPKGNQIASGSYDGTVRLWDIETGIACYILRDHTGWITSVAYSPKGDQIASGSRDNTLRLWDVETGAIHYTLSDHTNSAITCVVYSREGDQIALGRGDGTVRLWEVKTSTWLRNLHGHSREITSIVYSPKGNQIASSSDDKTVRLWDVGTGSVQRTLSDYKNSGVTSAVYSPEGDQIASGSYDGAVRLWNAETGACDYTLRGHSDVVKSVTYSPKGKQIASGSADNTVRLWDVETKSVRYTLSGHIGLISSVAYSPQGDQVASGSWDNTVRLWNAETGVASRTLSGHSSMVSSVAYLRQGDQIASGSFDNTVRLWDVKMGTCLRTLNGHGSIVWSVAYSLKDDQIASGSADNTVRLWDVETGDVLHILNDHIGSVYSIMYSPKGGQIVSGGGEHTVRLWDIETGQCQMVIEGFNGAVMSVVWKEASNGPYLVTASTDKSIRQWEIKKEKEKYKAFLCWSSIHTALTASNAVIRNVRGLSPVNEKLLKQHGAVGKTF